MLQQLWAFVMSLAKWPDGVVIKVGNELRTGGVASGEVLTDEQGRILFDDLGRFLIDSE